MLFVDGVCFKSNQSRDIPLGHCSSQNLTVDLIIKVEIVMSKIMRRGRRGLKVNAAKRALHTSCKNNKALLTQPINRYMMI